MFDLISIGCGAYILYTYIKLTAYGRLFPNSLLIPNGKTPKDCAHPEDYIRYVKPRMLVVGIIVLLLGIVSILNGSMQFFGFMAAMICNGITLLAVIWYGVCAVKAFKLYW